jgi:hypothetical protein
MKPLLFLKKKGGFLIKEKCIKRVQHANKSKKNGIF